MFSRKEHIIAFKISILLLIFWFFLFFIFQYLNHSWLLNLWIKWLNKYILIIFLAIFTYIISYFIAKITLKPIRENNIRLKEYNHNVAHELKTPLAVIKSDLELLEMWKKLDFDIIKSSKDEITNMQSIVDSLLFLSEWNNKLSVKKINIKTQINNIINKYFLENKDDFILNIKSSQFNFNKDLFDILIKNLIENALKYGDKEDKIKISFIKNKLTFKNSISSKLGEINKNKLFDAFYQADNSRNSSWYWLGLSIVKKIIILHKAKIDIDIRDGFFIVSIIF